MGLFDHFRRKKTSEAAEAEAGAEVKPQEERDDIESEKPEAPQEEKAAQAEEEVPVPEPQPEKAAEEQAGPAEQRTASEDAPGREPGTEPVPEETAETSGTSELNAGDVLDVEEKAEPEKPEAPESGKKSDAGSEGTRTGKAKTQRLGVTAIFRIDAAFAMDHDGTPSTLVSGILEKGTISLGDSLVLTDAQNRVRATFPVNGLERLGRDPLPKITYEEGTGNQNAYAIYVDNTDPSVFEKGFKCYRIEQNRGRNNPDRVSEKRAAQLAGILRTGILEEETLRKLSIQELCFMIRMIRQIHEQNEVNDFENKESTLEKELCRKVYEADVLYVTIDRTTNMPFLDQGAVDIYSKESFARDAVDFYRRQFRQLAILKYEKHESPFPDKMSLFRYLYYTGVNLVTIDNGQFKVTVDRDEIEKDPGLNELNRLPFKVTNPSLRFALNSLLSEARWPVKYKQHKQNVKTREVRMLDQLDKAILLLPVKAEGHRLSGLVTYRSLPKNAKIQIPHITDKKQQHFLPFFTDPFEFQRLYSTKEWAALPCDIKHALIMDPRIGIIINPVAENFVLTVEGKKALIAAFAQREKQLKEEEQAEKEPRDEEKPDIGPGSDN